LNETGITYTRKGLHIHGPLEHERARKTKETRFEIERDKNEEGDDKCQPGRAVSTTGNNDDWGGKRGEGVVGRVDKVLDSDERERERGRERERESERERSTLCLLVLLLLLLVVGLGGRSGRGRGRRALGVEDLLDLLEGLALDQRGDLGAAEVEERLDVHVVGGQDDIIELLTLLSDLVNVLGVPLVGADLLHFAVLEGLLNNGGLDTLVVVHVLDDLLEYDTDDGGDGDLSGRVIILEGSLDEDRDEGVLATHLKLFLVLGDELKNLILVGGTVEGQRGSGGRGSSGGGGGGG
jgi:hypothetical protein